MNGKNDTVSNSTDYCELITDQVVVAQEQYTSLADIYPLSVDATILSLSEYNFSIDKSVYLLTD